MSRLKSVENRYEELLKKLLEEQKKTRKDKSKNRET